MAKWSVHSVEQKSENENHQSLAPVTIAQELLVITFKHRSEVHLSFPIAADPRHNANHMARELSVAFATDIEEMTLKCHF